MWSSIRFWWTATPKECRSDLSPIPTDISRRREYGSSTHHGKRMNERPRRNLNRHWQALETFRMSYVLWVYVKEYCRHLYCSVINKSDYYQQKYSPTILINYAGELWLFLCIFVSALICLTKTLTTLRPLGNIVIELVEMDGTLSSIQSVRVLPANDWCRVVITLEKSQVSKVENSCSASSLRRSSFFSSFVLVDHFYQLLGRL